MRQPRARRASPKARRPRSCCSPGAQASTATGPMPRPQPRASPRRRPRSSVEAKCSCAIETSPRSQRGGEAVFFVWCCDLFVACCCSGGERGGLGGGETLGEMLLHGLYTAEV